MQSLLADNRQVWICPDAVQQSPCTERGSRCLLSSGSPPGPPPLYCRGVFLTEAHPLDREGRLEEEALPPPPLGTCG